MNIEQRKAELEREKIDKIKEKIMKKLDKSKEVYLSDLIEEFDDKPDYIIKALFELGNEGKVTRPKDLQEAFEEGKQEGITFAQAEMLKMLDDEIELISRVIKENLISVKNEPKEKQREYLIKEVIPSNNRLGSQRYILQKLKSQLTGGMK